MPRPRKCSTICSPPVMKGFKPYGMPSCRMESIKMTYEEYESLRLVNYDKLSQDQAAKEMNVSRPTLTRIYNRAIQVVATAFTEGKSIVIDGGNYNFEKDRYICKTCHKLVEGNKNNVKCQNYNESNPMG
jgi:predicted DNA-binding protein (UPF0251 family)